MEKKELSKIKHVYRIYASEDNIAHCEKHPVIYMNSDIVYYKRARRGFLGMVHTSHIKEKFESYRDLNINTSYYNHIYLNEWFYEVKNFNSKEITDIVFKKDKLNELDSAEKEFKEAERKIEEAERDFKAKKEIFEKLKEKYL